MEKIKTNSGFKKFRNIVLRTIMVLVLLLLLLSIALSTPLVQNKIAHYATEKLNQKFGTNINIDEVAITLFGGIKLKKVLILDHHKDTLIYSGRIKTSIYDLKQLMEGRLLFGDLRLDHFYLQIKNYKNEHDTNLDLFVAAFDDGKPGSGKFLMTSKNVYLTDSRFVQIDENRKNPKDVDFSEIKAYLQDFKIKGPNVYANIASMSFKDFRGLPVENLKAHFTYTRSNIILKNLEVKAPESYLRGNVRLNYNRDNKDFSDFNNRVKFDVVLDSALVSSNDIRYFYKELGKDQRFYLKSKIKGTLNNFYASGLNLVDGRNSIIRGDVNFRNLFPKSPGKFYMKGNFRKISSNYTNLAQLLPNILGKKLPSTLSKLGQFNFTGNAEITQEFIDADFVMNTALGIVESDIRMSDIDNIDNAKYKGNVILDNFDIGTLVNDKKVGKVSLNFDVEGKGFTREYLSTTIVGDVNKLVYNNYTYTKIIMDGSFKFPIFQGLFYINDPNLRMDFNGVVDLSKKENNYDFHATVDYANLNELKFVKDSISVFKGDVVIKAQGNTLDNLKGNFLLTNSSYQNAKDLYFFDYLNVNSIFDEDGERAITITSSDIIEGSIVGKYKFSQIQKIAENCLGSLYANYRPNQVLPGQYLKFDISLNNKIIEIFNPDVSISKNTRLKGNISSETKNFKLDFVSPKITAFDVTLDNLSFKLDNKNPLYNSYVQLDTVKTKYYKIRDLSLINTFVNDSLHFRTEFKGGDKGQDYYKLDFYHTINEENKNVIGFNKSELFFKDR
ncbi:MAG: translocation/assembly module TamB, partial [Flavobacterium sp.]